MASILKVDELRGIASAGDITVTSEGGAAAQSLQQGLAKVWVNFNGTGTIATRDSLNVSGLTDNGTGNYTVAYSNNMGSANYALGNSGADSGTVFECWLGSGYGLPTSSNTGLGSGYDTPVAADLSIVTSMIMGDLA